MKTNTRLLVATGLAASALSAQAALTVLDSSGFANKYNGDEIFDGAATINGWAAAGGQGSDPTFVLNGSNVVATINNTNGWLQHDNGSTPWEGGVGSWTVEVRANMSATGTGGFNIWGALNGERDIMTIRENQVSNLGGTVYNAEPNTGAFHDFRLAYDSAEGVYHYFRDGVQITPLGGVPRQGTTGSTRLIIGDCCTNAGGSTTGFGGVGSSFEIAYVRYDNTGAFSPVPEPSTTAFFGLAGLAFLLRRRR